MVANHWARTGEIDKDREKHTKNSLLALSLSFFVLSLALLLVILLLWLFKVKVDCFQSVFMPRSAESVGRIECVRTGTFFTCSRPLIRAAVQGLGSLQWPRHKCSHPKSEMTRAISTSISLHILTIHERSAPARKLFVRFEIQKG